MTDPIKTLDPIAVQEAFWELRKATDEKIADRLQAVMDAIEEGRESGLYRDGLPTRLNDISLSVQHHLTKLRPAVQPSAAAPAPIPPAT